MSLARSVPLASTVAPIRRRLLLPARSWMVIAAVVVSLIALLPLGFIVWTTFETSWATASALVFRPRVGDLLANSLLLIVLAVPIAAALALTLAWLTVRSDLPGGRMWAWLLVAPLAVPAFVQSYAWVSLVPSLQGLFGGVLVSVLAYFPFLYLPLLPRSAASTRRSRTVPPRSALAPGGSFCGSRCRSCASPSAAVHCWSGCTFFPNMASMR